MEGAPSLQRHGSSSNTSRTGKHEHQQDASTLDSRVRSPSLSDVAARRGLEAPSPLVGLGHHNHARTTPTPGTIITPASQPPSTAASGRASPAQTASNRSVRHLSSTSLAGLPSARSPPLTSHSSSGSTYGVPQLKNLESYSARNVAAALEPTGSAQSRSTDDVWQTVCVRVLPLFNGEGIRGYVEDLNELVTTHVQRTFQRCQATGGRAALNPSTNLAALVTGLLTADLSELLRIGTTTLSEKLAPTTPLNGPSDEEFLSRLNVAWLFFWGNILPHLEGVFWVLRTDERLRAAVEGTQTPGSSSHANPILPPQIGSSFKADAARVDVRKLALIEFRDQLIHPHVDRLLDIFQDMRDHESKPTSGANTPARRSSRAPPQQRQQESGHQPNESFSSATTVTPTGSSSPPEWRDRATAGHSRASSVPRVYSAATMQAVGRRRQMIAMLASVQTQDERQAEIDILLRTIRLSSLHQQHDLVSVANANVNAFQTTTSTSRADLSTLNATTMTMGMTRNHSSSRQGIPGLLERTSSKTVSKAVAGAGGGEGTRRAVIDDDSDDQEDEDQSTFVNQARLAVARDQTPTGAGAGSEGVVDYGQTASTNDTIVAR
ncbi:hypothetical protein ACM66B_004550 [Microbotryomycetes sp. NB124-2]